MKEPIVLAVAALAGGATASLGSVIGIPVEALIAGLFGGLVSILALPSKRADGEPPKRGVSMYLALAASVFVATACAGFFGPFTAALFDLPAIPDHLEIKAMSFLWGAGAQAGLLVTAIEALRSRLDAIKATP